MDKSNQNQDFLQSEEWRKFQEAVGKRTFLISEESFHAVIIEHKLPVVGKYFYVPRGPVLKISNFKFQISNEIKNSNDQIKKVFSELLRLAKKEKAGWIRFDAENENVLAFFSKVEPFSTQGSTLKIKKAPHDMQPKEVFVIDISKSEEDLLKEMKSKTRYNIKLAEQKGVQIRIMNYELGIKYNYLEKFLRLVKKTSERQGITSHPENYYRKMLETIPPEIIKLYVAEYEGKIIATNIMIFFGDTATYLHGASDNEYRNVMAPYLLQWQAIQDAKKLGLKKYDFGGISTRSTNNELRIMNSWVGITKFKLGFSPATKPIEFTGSYDIVVSPWKYGLYIFLQKLKSLI